MASKLSPQDLIFVIGCPGAGKGTLCSKLAAKWKWAHVSVGDELRKYCLKNAQEDDAVVTCIRQAELVPVEQLAQILNHGIEQLKEDGYTSFIIDGFPRDVSQISYIQDKVGVPSRVLLMECPEEVAKERVLTRQIAGRTDTEEIFEKRFLEFQMKNPNVVARFEDEGKLTKIDTSHATEISFQHVLMALEAHVGVTGVKSNNETASDELGSDSSSASIMRSNTPPACTTIYLVGAPAAGKTTLIKALSHHFRQYESQKAVVVVSEVARELVAFNKIDPKDIQLGEETAMDLQRQILVTQKLREENLAQDSNLVLCDRSGIDPIVFATKYGGKSYGQRLLSSDVWSYLRPRMQQQVVILCEPVSQWFVADGVRIDVESMVEQDEIHAAFFELLQSEAITPKILSATVTDHQERVDFVLTALREMEKSRSQEKSISSSR